MDLLIELTFIAYFNLQCFDAVCWATGKTPGLQKNSSTIPKVHFLGPSELELVWVRKEHLKAAVIVIYLYLLSLLLICLFLLHFFSVARAR